MPMIISSKWALVYPIIGGLYLLSRASQISENCGKILTKDLNDDDPADDDCYYYLYSKGSLGRGQSIAIKSLTPPDLDLKLTIERFDRTEEQNEELGLNDMNVDGYGE